MSKRIEPDKDGNRVACRWKVYRRGELYVAACKFPDEAAILVGILGDGSTVLYDHKLVVWREDKDNVAADSYDHAAQTMYDTLNDTMFWRREDRRAAKAAAVKS